MTTELITPAGLEQLKKEIAQLEHDERPAISQAIAEARAHGDLSENAEYHAAKDKQGMIEARITYLRNIMNVSTLIDPARVKKDGKVRFHSTVVIENEEGKRNTWQIVGNYESNPEESKLSSSSPLGNGLLGKEVGGTCMLANESSTQLYKIISID